MSFSNKLKSILSVTGHKPADLADCLGISVQSVRNKIFRGSYSVDDLLKIFDYLECEVTVKTKDGIVFPLTIDDVRDSESVPAKKADEEEELTDMDRLIINAVLNPSVPPEGTKVITAEDILKRNE